MDSDSPRVVVFIGGTSGLGFEALKQLVALPGSTWHIILGSRSPLSTERYDELIKARSSPSTSIEHNVCDLRIRVSVNAFATMILSNVPSSLYAIVLCSAIVCKGRREVEGEEETLQVNVLNQAFLLDILLSKLERGTRGGRVVFVGSQTHRAASTTDKITPSTINDVLSPARWSAMSSYRVTKLVHMHLFYLTHDILSVDEDGPIAVALTPGFVPVTGLAREQPWYMRFVIRNIISYLPFATTLQEGGKVIYSAIVDESLQSGIYLSNSGPILATAECYDKTIRESWANWLIDHAVWKT